ncbi:MAG: histidine phosphatase family protein [Ardenticatenaceae bacterium]|nr:histidine phosphatase family protein [Ardenticatenaceae bacterium]
MKIYLARHGQSRWQVTQTEGDWNSPLTELGQQQAQHLGTWLAEHEALDNGSRLEIGQVWVSPLIRAQETAVPIANALHIPSHTDDCLRETEFYIAPHLPTAVSPYQTHAPYTPSTEYSAFKEQAQQALHNLVAAAESSNMPVLAVSHGGLISTLLRLATGSDAISFWIYNTSLNLIEWKRGRWHLVHLNLWDHLPPSLRTF